MLYLIDANVLIDAQRDYYARDRVPQFWDWLLHHAANGNIKMTRENLEEILDSKDSEKGKVDPLVVWCGDSKVQKVLVLEETAYTELVQDVTANGYANDLKDDEILTIGRDPFLIAAALANNEERIVVTTEVSQPKKERANKKVPDVCRLLGVKCVNTFALVRELNFSTDWERKIK